MKDSKEMKLQMVKEAFEKEGLYGIEFPNGQLQIEGANFWATKEKWYCPRTDTKGKGINSFIKHVKEQLIK